MRTHDLDKVGEIQLHRIFHVEQLLGEAAVEDAPVVGVDRDGIVHLQPGAQERVVCVALQTQGEQVGGGADLDAWRLPVPLQLGQLPEKSFREGKKYIQ